MSSPANSLLSTVLERAQADFPAIVFTPANSFYWSSEQQTVFYNPEDEDPTWSLLHELGHMQRGHSSYTSDTQLITMEVEAWDTAVTSGRTYGVIIDEDHIQDCLDSYRAWRHARSKCPTCTQAGIEIGGEYRCINCQNTWRVSDNRFCRTYRMLQK